MNNNNNTNNNPGNNNTNNINNNQLDSEQYLEFSSPALQFDFNNFHQLFEYQQLSLLRMNNSYNINRNGRLEDDLMLFWPPRLRMEQPSSPRHKNQNLEKYMQKRNQPIHNDELNKNEPYIKVSVLRNMNYPNTNHSNEYFINQYGLIGSQKNADSEDILIGRSHRSEIIPNDIMLPEDRIISRIHCKIVCKSFFLQDQIMEPLYKRTLKQIILPRRALKIVSSFLEEPKHAYVQDLGSMCGTQFKILKNEPTLIRETQKYIIGSDTQFTIQVCEPYKADGQQLDEQFYKLLKKLASSKPQSKHEVHFSENQLQPKFKSASMDDEKTEDSKGKEEELIYKKLRLYKVPLIIIKFSGSGIDPMKTFNIFIGSETSDSNDFLIGRGQENNIKINSNTISRKQSRFKYSQRLKSWVIFDGSKERDSANGTWVSLSTVEQAEKKLESDKMILKNNSEIKISEFILKIELFQGRQDVALNCRLQQKINKQLLNELLND